MENLCRNMRSLIVNLTDNLDFYFRLTGQITIDFLKSVACSDCVSVFVSDNGIQKIKYSSELFDFINRGKLNALKQSE